MHTYLVSVSPKGQITIPKKEREKNLYNKYILEAQGSTLILHPVKIDVIKDELQDFHQAATKSFAFWDNPSDDVFNTFYEDIPDEK